MKIKNIVVTGAAGFVGSNLCKKLLKLGYSLSGIDNFSQGYKRNIEDILNNPNFTFKEGDVRDRKTMRTIIADADCVIHLAAFKIPRYGNSLDTLEINAQGTRNALEAASENGCKMIFASTSDVYGKSPDLPFREDGDLCIGPSYVRRWAYAVSKIYDEHLCFAYAQEKGLTMSIVRYFGGYGPNHNLNWRGGPQAVFIDCALQDKPMPIHGDGLQTRSFIYIDDMVGATIKVMENPKANGEIFNIGGTNEITILELAQLIWKMSRDNAEPKITYIPYEQFPGKYEDIKRRRPDITKAKDILNFQAKVGLEEGLSRTIQWQKNIHVEEKLK